MAADVRHLVLDSEAVSALLSPRASDPKRRVVVRAIAAANGRVAVPAVVRAEAGWDRTAPDAAQANRQVELACDVSFGSDEADRAVQLRRAVRTASVVDAAVAVAADKLGSNGGVVQILTSDVPDLSALAAHLTARTDIKHL